MSFATFFATSASRAASPGVVNRRLVGGLLLSLVFHALLLTLQFGVPGLGLPSPFTPLPVSMTVMLPAVVAPSLEKRAPLLLAPGGMRLVDPAPPPVAPKPQPVKTAKPAKPRRISRPLPPRVPVPTPTRVIARDQNPNDSFVVPPQPQAEAAPQKADDPERVQAGSDDGADLQAAHAQQAEEDSRRQAELAARADDALEQQRRAGQELAQRRQADEQGRRETALLQQRAIDERARQQIEQRKIEQHHIEQQAGLAAARQQADERALKQKAEELAFQQKTDEQVAALRADDLARQQAAEAAAADQRERERSVAAAAAIGNPGAGDGGSGGSGTVPKNLLGSDAGNRVRELTRGIDLLHGAPPRSARGDERGTRRAVVGSGERDVPLRMYVDSFRQKIERNGGQGFTSQVGDRAGTDPLVSVALRSDGSVDDVTIVRSSGNADTDNAVRRIIRLNARYSAFPPNIADRYDVIEVRRIWRFAETLRLLEELR